MLITAHSGAEGTKQNGKEFFDAIESGEIVADILEVDIWGNEQLLYLSHAPVIFTKKKMLSLKYAFNVAKSKGMRINCDLKKHGLIVPVLNLAKQCGVQNLVIFTGEVCPCCIKHLDAGEVYANNHFYKSKTGQSDPFAIKQYLNSFNNAGLRGINVNYKSLTKAFADKAKEAGLKISAYTADNEKAIKMLIEMDVENITTNAVKLANKIKEN
jgi:hypothetical protein